MMASPKTRTRAHRENLSHSGLIDPVFLSQLSADSQTTLTSFVSKTLRDNIGDLIKRKNSNQLREHEKQVQNLITTNVVQCVAIIDVSGFSSLASRWEDKVEVRTTSEKQSDEGSDE